MTGSARRTEGEGCRNDKRGHVQDEATAEEAARGVVAEAPKTAEERGEQNTQRVQASRQRAKERQAARKPEAGFCILLAYSLWLISSPLGAGVRYPAEGGASTSLHCRVGRYY